MSTYQMLWDCPQCDTEKLLGIDSPVLSVLWFSQDPASRYYPSDEDKVHADESNRYTGADIACPSCETPNAAIAVHCVACGAPTEGGKEVVRRQEKEESESDDSRAARSEHKQGRQEARAQRLVDLPDEDAEGDARGGVGKAGMAMGVGLGTLVLLGIGAVVSVLAVGMCLGMFFFTSSTTLVVQSHSWERSIEIESKQAVTERAWRDKVPSGATGVSCKKEVRETKKVKNGEDCKKTRVDNGNGTFTEKKKCTPRFKEEKVFDQKCSFSVIRWETKDTRETSGDSIDDDLVWPKIRLSKGERQGPREERYEVTLKGEDGESHSCELPEKTWRSMKKGSTWEGEVAAIGGLKCDALQPR